MENKIYLTQNEACAMAGIINFYNDLLTNHTKGLKKLSEEEYAFNKKRKNFWVKLWNSALTTLKTPSKCQIFITEDERECLNDQRSEWTDEFMSLINKVKDSCFLIKEGE